MHVAKVWWEAPLHSPWCSVLMTQSLILFFNTSLLAFTCLSFFSSQTCFHGREGNIAARKPREMEADPEARSATSKNSGAKPKKEKRKTRKEKDCNLCGATGHLAKYCSQLLQKQEEGGERAHLIYRPPSRIRFKSETDLTAFKDRIIAFKYQSKKNVCENIGVGSC